jgi:flagellar basal body rod protein FlgB
MAANGIDKALGISPQVLALRMKRMNLLTANIANADTPKLQGERYRLSGRASEC